MSEKFEIYNYEDGLRSIELFIKNLHLQTIDSNQIYSCEGKLLKVNNISKIDLSTVINPTYYNAPISETIIEMDEKLIDEYNINIRPVDRRKMSSGCYCQFFNNCFTIDLYIDILVFSDLVKSIDNSFLKKKFEIKLFVKFAPTIEEIYSINNSYEILKDGGRLYLYRLEFEDSGIDNTTNGEIKIEVSHNEDYEKEKFIDFQFSSN